MQMVSLRSDGFIACRRSSARPDGSRKRGERPASGAGRDDFKSPKKQLKTTFLSE
jgi:hypothetical protein